jgi:hypothetical protein
MLADIRLPRRRTIVPDSANKPESESTSTQPVLQPKIGGTLEELSNEANRSQHGAASHPGITLPSRPLSLPVESQVSTKCCSKHSALYSAVTERLSPALYRYLFVDL